MKDNISSTIAVIKDSKPAENRFAEQLYYSAGLGPEIEEGIREYDQHMQGENKLLNKVLGTRGSDIRGYGEAVAKKVAVAVYNQLSQQYGGKVGDLRSYIMTLEEERDRANQRYDDLMGRAIGILGEEYKELRTDSKEFMEKLTNVMGEDLKASRINSEEITEKLADIDGLRSELRTLSRDKEQLKERYESQIAAINNEHKIELTNLEEKHESQIADLNNEHKTELANLEEKNESQISAINNDHKVEIRNFNERHESQTTEASNQHKAEIKDFNLQIDALAKEKDLLADTSAKEKEQQKERFEQQMVEVDNQHKAEIKDLNLRIDALSKEKELLADRSAREKEQQKERFEQQIATINNDHKVEIRNLTEKHESQMTETNNEHKAELRKLNSRVEILTKEKELQKEQYESQIAELDSTARGSTFDESADDLEQPSEQVALEAGSQA